MTKFKFKKVEHKGAHQDYRVYWIHGALHLHICNVRGMWKRNGRYTSWAARSDYDGTEIVLSSSHGRRALCLAMLACLKAMGWVGRTTGGGPRRFYAGEIMQTTRDVGADEPEPAGANR